MGKKVLFLDSPYFMDPYRWGIETNLQEVVVDIHKDLNKAIKGIRNNEYDLVIVEPMEFSSLRGESAVLPVLTEAKARSIPILVHSIKNQDALSERLGVTDGTYYKYSTKVGIKPEDFYKKVAEMLRTGN